MPELNLDNERYLLNLLLRDDPSAKGVYDSPTTGYYTPTLVVGLGGFGTRALRVLKKYLLRNKAQHIRLLGIDSDRNEPGKNPDLPKLKDSEFALLDSQFSLDALKRAQKGDEQYRFVLDFLPDQAGAFKGNHMNVRKRIQGGAGAGQFRRAGRLLFTTNVMEGACLGSKFNDIRTDLVGLPTTVGTMVESRVQITDGIRILVVCSAAGGTGAGCLLDCLALLRSVFNGPYDTISVVLGLPGMALDPRLIADPVTEKPNTRGNAIALMRELTGLMKNGGVNHDFHFAGHAPYRHDATQPLLNHCFPIYDHLHSGTPIGDWDEMSALAAYYLYAIVGTGIGASRESSAVNGPVELMPENQDRVFGSFGVAGIEVPYEEFHRAAMWSVFEKLCVERLDSKYGKTGVNEQVSNLMGGELGLLTAGDVRGAVLAALTAVDPGDISGASALFQGQGGESMSRDLKAYVFKVDDDFFLHADAIGNERSAALATASAIIPKATAHAAADLGGRLRRGAAKLLVGNLHLAADACAVVENKLKGLLTEILACRQELASRIQDTNETLEKLRARIHKWDAFFDQGPRRKYIKILAGSIQDAIQDALWGASADLLRRLLGNDPLDESRDHAAAVREDAARLVAQMETLRQGVTMAALEWRNKPSRYSFMQPSQDPAGWEHEIRSISPDFKTVPYALSIGSVVASAMSAADAVIRQRLDGTNLVTHVKKDNKLHNRVKSLQFASSPAIRLQEGARNAGEMMASAFMAGGADKLPKELLGLVKGLTGNEAASIPLGNNHMLLVLQAVYRFGLCDCHFLDEFWRAYKNRRWYNHVLPDFDSLPGAPIASQDRAEKLELFGLALMFDFIRQQGNNKIYCNYQVLDGRHLYPLGLREDAPEFPQAMLDAELLEAASVRPSPKAMQELRLADSLKSAFDSFSNENRWGFLCGGVREKSDALFSVRGTEDAAQMIEAFIAVLNKQIGASNKASPERAELLTDVVNALTLRAKKTTT